MKTQTYINNRSLGQLIVILYFLAISFGYAQDRPGFKKRKVIVSGNVQLTKGSSKVISLIYSQLKGSPIRLAIVLDSIGNFQFDFDILQAHDVTLKYEQGQASLYIRPLDSLYVRINASDFHKAKYPNYLVSGTNPEVSRDMLKYNQFNTLDNFKPVPVNKSTKEYLVDIENRILAEDSVLSVFNEQYNPSPEFRIWAEKDIIYRNANYLVDFEFFHFAKKTTFEGDLYDTRLFPIDDTDAMKSSWYQYHLWQYVQSKYIQGDSVVRDLLKAEKRSEAYTVGLNRIIQGEIPGLGRDLMCYEILSSLAERAGDTFEILMKNVENYISDKELISVLREELHLTKNQSKYQISLLKSDSKVEKGIIGDIVNNLISTHRGKIIYIDFWATWCGPCRSEVPFAIDLHELYKDKPVVFVNLCLYSEREAWKNAVDKQKIAGENYFFDKDQSDLLKSRLKIGGFPTYMIIGKDGQIIDRQAPRPSSGDIIKTYLTKLMQ